MSTTPLNLTSHEDGEGSVWLEFEPHPSENDDTGIRQDSNMSSSSSSKQQTESDEEKKQNDKKLKILFLVMVFVGTSFTVGMKLQAIPMYNYPNFLNLFGVVTYIPLTFAYIIPVARYGLFGNAINQAQMSLSKINFAGLAVLDTLATMMQTFSCVYLPGPLVVLLPQAAIPISMALSRQILKERYRWMQYGGAVVVLLGLLVVMEPVVTKRHEPDFVCVALNMTEDCSICQVETNQDDCLSHRTGVDDKLYDSFTEYYMETIVGNNTNGDTVCEWASAHDVEEDNSKGPVLMWAFILILSCVPMSLSNILKDILLSDKELQMDPIYLNGWIVVFQSIFSVVMSVPAGLVSSPRVPPGELLSNIYNGLKCYLGIGSITTGCHPDIACGSLLVNITLILSILYILCMMYMLKYGSANIFFLANTAMVPLGNLFFALPFVPGSVVPHFTDVLGLVVIVGGLLMYKFGDSRPQHETETGETESLERSSTLQQALLSDIQEEEVEELGLTSS